MAAREQAQAPLLARPSRSTLRCLPAGARLRRSPCTVAALRLRRARRCLRPPHGRCAASASADTQPPTARCGSTFCRGLGSWRLTTLSNELPEERDWTSLAGYTCASISRSVRLRMVNITTVVNLTGILNWLRTGGTALSSRFHVARDEGPRTCGGYDICELSAALLPPRSPAPSLAQVTAFSVAADSRV